MNSDALSIAVSQVPAGRWIAGVSGGADSVALLLLLAAGRDLSLHVVHLNHQTRGADSDNDAKFVAELADLLSLPCTIARRDEIEPRFSHLPVNPSARYRTLRMELFKSVAGDCLGVILGHHADDQAETIALRLLRGSGPTGLAGMTFQRRINGLAILRPLLNVRRAQLRDYLTQQSQSWREDASNESQQYARNRVRKWLASQPQMVQPLLDLGLCCGEWSRWIGQNAPDLNDHFAVVKLADLPRMLAREAARKWLRKQGAAPVELTPVVLDRLRQMAFDAATAARAEFPGGIRIRRRAGHISRDAAPTLPR